MDTMYNFLLIYQGKGDKKDRLVRREAVFLLLLAIAILVGREDAAVASPVSH